MTINQFRVHKLNTFREMFGQIQDELLDTEPVVVGEWQSQEMTMPMLELRNVVLSMPLPQTQKEMAEMTGAHLPWAEDHFHERVGGQPLNPPPAEAWWPFRQKKDGDTNTDHKSEGGGKFSHTYPERMWPKTAGEHLTQSPHRNTLTGEIIEPGRPVMMGIRFEYGDLMDVVEQLHRSPHTRQAYLPIWFPEDTGAVHGKRVPCTLGYHFTIRDSVLDITYFMRSTDLLRHFQDDIYMAGRLAQWVAHKLNSMDFGRKIEVGELIFHTANMHIFQGDIPAIEYRKSQGNDAWA